MDREALKRIIAEELRRAIDEEERRRSGDPIPSGPSRPDLRHGLLLLTGCEPLEPEAVRVLTPLLERGFRLDGIASKSYRDSNGLRGEGQHAGLPRAISLQGEFESEAAEKSFFEARAFIVIPDISSNSVAKAALGIADSLPSRAIAHFIAKAKPTVFLETVAPTIYPRRTSGRDERLRKLERRGATLAEPSDFLVRLEASLARYGGSVAAPMGKPGTSRRAIVTAEDIHEALRRGEEKYYVPLKAIVTDQARDEAVRRGVEIIEGDGGDA